MDPEEMHVHWNKRNNINFGHFIDFLMHFFLGVSVALTILVLIETKLGVFVRQN
jgi:hypothetical protein